MPDDLSTPPIDDRERVMVFLAFLTSEECLDACRRHAAPEVLAEALCRLWFDEIYVPGTNYLDGIKGDRYEAAVRRFETCFTEEELVTLERFHGFFELRLDMAANRMQGRARFPDNDSWQSLRRDAASLLSDLAPDPDRLRHLLAAFVADRFDGADASLLDALRRPRLLG